MTEAVAEKAFNPKDFAELFCHLRTIHALSFDDMARVVRYSPAAVQTNETTTHNPSIKTLLRYIQPFCLELIINPQGITIWDPVSKLKIVENWQAVFR